MERPVTLRKLINQLQKLVETNPDVGDTIVVTVHSASGAIDHLNSFHVHEVTDYDIKSEFGFFYEDENIEVGQKVIHLSVGGN